MSKVIRAQNASPEATREFVGTLAMLLIAEIDELKPELPAGESEDAHVERCRVQAARIGTVLHEALRLLGVQGVVIDARAAAAARH